MILFLISFSVGIEGGYSLPFNGFGDIERGVGLTIALKKFDTPITYGLSLRTVYYSGRNPAYSLNKNDLGFLLYMAKWHLSPVLEIGADYITRTVHAHKEVGYGLYYGLGFLINLNLKPVRIVPGMYYEGVTDFKKIGGFFGLRLGIDYEI